MPVTKESAAAQENLQRSLILEANEEAVHRVPITGKDISEALKDFKTWAGVGQDMWQPHSWRRLPSCLLDALAALYSSIEKSAAWPTQVTSHSRSSAA